MSFCYYIVSNDGERTPPYLYRGKDAADVFVKQIRQEALKIKDLYSYKKNMLPLTDRENETFQSSRICLLLYYKTVSHCIPNFLTHAFKFIKTYV